MALRAGLPRPKCLYSKHLGEGGEGAALRGFYLASNMRQDPLPVYYYSTVTRARSSSSLITVQVVMLITVVIADMTQ